MTRIRSHRRDRRSSFLYSFVSASALVIAAVVVALGAAPAGGIGVDGQTAFGVAPSTLPNGQPRPYFTLSIAPGQSAHDTAVITNRGSNTITLKLSPSTGITAVNSGSTYSGSFKPCTGTGCWISGLPSTVTLAPNASQTMVFTVTVPKGSTPGQYLAGITAEPKVPPPPIIVGSNGSASAKATIVEQVSVGVAVNVGDPSQFTSELRIVTVTAAAVASMSATGRPHAQRGRDVPEVSWNGIVQ